MAGLNELPFPEIAVIIYVVVIFIFAILTFLLPLFIYRIARNSSKILQNIKVLSHNVEKLIEIIDSGNAAGVKEKKDWSL